ncbi:apolipoprotein N-acyltransferase [Pelagibacterium luteolum]|uniref:Apolipoprotein N-acyltransferase n=2 Tax=Pelagibacterium luteolum TaxID=440168 RepID=A0A1G7Z484_9HYPH|nr:apolipoprotein N-acyltransferase [Pelagibacterium luteolum]
MGWWFGLGLGLATFPWLAHAFSFQSAMPYWLGWAAVAALAAYTALYWAVSLGLAHALTRSAPPAIFAIHAAALFVMAEWLRGWLLTGFPWNPLAAIWIPVPEVAQTASVIGAFGLSGLTMLVVGMAAAAARRDGLAPLFASLLGSAILVSATQTAAPLDTQVRISLVQANIDQSEKWLPGEAERQLGRYIALTRDEDVAGPRLVFWPETAILLPLDANPALQRAAVAGLGPDDLLFTGAVGDAPDFQHTNSVFVLDAAGSILARYDKAHLVPFGEYLPFAAVLERFGAARLVPGAADFVAGPGPATVELEGLKVGVAICYEVVFPASVVDSADRPAFLFNPSNDAWFGWGGPEQHLAQARLRAIEEGLPVIRATPTGHTAVIRSDGSIAAGLPAGRAARLDTYLPTASEPTLFAVWGNAIPLGASFMLLVAGLAVRRSTGGSKN